MQRQIMLLVDFLQGKGRLFHSKDIAPAGFSRQFRTIWNPVANSGGCLTAGDCFGGSTWYRWCSRRAEQYVLESLLLKMVKLLRSTLNATFSCADHSLRKPGERCGAVAHSCALLACYNKPWYSVYVLEAERYEIPALALNRLITWRRWSLTLLVWHYSCVLEGVELHFRMCSVF